jgi:hypothetical protein
VTSENKEFSINSKNYTGIDGAKFYGNILYDGKKYAYGYSGKPILLVKKNQVEKILKEMRVVKGVKVN